MKKLIPLLLLFTLSLTGCQIMYSALVLIRGTDEKPKYEILLKGEKRVVVVPRAAFSNSFELQNAPREIARQVNTLLDTNVRNKKLRVVEQAKVETWLDHVGNDFESFLEVGRDKSIQADIVIGFDIVEFRIRDPMNSSLLQGRCVVEVRAIDCETGEILARETLSITEPPNMPLPGNPRLEPQFRAQFLAVISQRIAALFHHYDKQKLQRMDGDSLELHRVM